MNKTFSLILDLSRLIAALLVLIHHAEQDLSDKPLPALASFGHDSVIFFFLLSGFVIAFVTTNKEKNLSEYIVARIARIYSVAIPAIVLSWILWQLGEFFFPASYITSQDFSWTTTFLTSAIFINQSSFFHNSIPTNGPYWSINYEVWYYIIFGIYFYTRGLKKYFILAIALIISGPKIILLLPIWLLGMCCYHYHQRLDNVSKYAGYILIIASTSIYLYLRAWQIDDLLFSYSSTLFGGEYEINQFLGFSKRFVPDYLISIIFITAFAGIYIARNDLETIINNHCKSITFLSSLTFSIYLFHSPLLIFIDKIIPNGLATIALTIFIIFIIGLITERQKAKLAIKLKSSLKKHKLA